MTSAAVNNDTSATSDSAPTLLSVEDLVVEFKTKHGTVQAVSGVSFELVAQETLSVVGESGSGKSTIAKAVMQLVRPAGGRVVFEGRNLAALSGRALRALRPEMQMIFQDPIASLNPRRKVRDIVSEGLAIWPDRSEAPAAEVVDTLLRQVGFNPETVADRRPAAFSGGQCQRIAVARVLALRPRLLVCDEPVSALDVSVQAQILNLIRQLKRDYALTMLFISHDLTVVKNVSDRVLVLYLGKVCEIGPTEKLFAAPAHPYTQLLLASVPGAHVPEQRNVTERQASEMPSPLNPPSGCRFRTRCPLATDLCAAEEPALREIGPGQFAACHYAEIAQAGGTTGAVLPGST